MGTPHTRLPPRLLAVLLLAVAGASMAYVARRSSPTWDETHLWGIGYYFWKTGRFDIPGVLVHPPLSHYLNSLSLLGHTIPLDTFGAGRGYRFVLHVARGNALLQRMGLDAFVAARTPFILAYCLAGAAVFAWARRWWGGVAGLFSLALYLLCPTLMAHGYLITTDGLLGAVLFLALTALVRSLERPTAASVALFVVSAAVAPAVKLTGLLVGPLAALCVVGRGLIPGPLVVWAPGHGRRWTTGAGFLAYWTGTGALTAVATYAVLVFACQGEWSLATDREAIQHISVYVARGHPMYLDGRMTTHGFREFYLKALIYKTPPTILAVWALALLVPAASSRTRALVPIALAAAVIGYFSLSGYTLGLRFVLVALPLLHVAAGRFVAPGRWARARRTVAAGILVLALTDIGVFYPYPRAYVNRAVVRGPGWMVLADADLDWGEGLIALREWVGRRGLGPIALSYHGSVAPAVLGVETSWYENPLKVKPTTHPEHGLLFISATNLAGVYFTDPRRYRWLWAQPPVDVVGGTIWVYDLDTIPAERKWR